MLSWKKFLEAKGCDIEDMEEKLHMDLDNDKEKGESETHKKKVFGKMPTKSTKKDED